MQETVITNDEAVFPTQKTIEDIDLPIFDTKGKIDGLMEGKLVEGKKWALVIKARSTVKFVFQILIWILIYSMVLSSLMILKTENPFYVHASMIFISFCAVGVGTSVTLYVFYPLIAPRIFDFHHGFFYTKPLSSYIHIGTWDSIRIIPLYNIQSIQTIRIEKWKNHVDQTNIVLQDGNRIALMTRKNAPVSQAKEDAQKLATRLVVPLWETGTVTL